MNGDEDEDAAESGGREAGGGGGGNVTEMEIMENFVRSLVEGWRYQARVGDVPYALIIVLYASMILVGGMGNLLVILVVVRNAAMRTARNVFIVNLAVSDLMLCLITMPLTLVEILYQTWQFGEYPLACPVAAMLQGISIFVSTLSITAIALDRRQLIVHPHRSAVGIRAMLALVPIVWAISIAMASPMAIWKKLEYWTDMPMNHLFDDDNDDVGSPSNSSSAAVAYDCGAILNATTANGEDEQQETPLANEAYEDAKLNCMLKAIMPRWLHELQTCKEDFPEGGRLVYSSVTMLIQYLLPTITISVAYYQILGQLRMRLKQKKSQLAANSTNGHQGGALNPGSGSGGAGGSNTNAAAERIENDVQRMKRTMHLLIWVGLMFCLCWLPLNVYNTVMDITQKYRIDMEKGKKTEASTMTDEQLCILYAVCHVTSMLSACANPVIYGYLNENFNREFKDIFSKLGLTRLSCKSCRCQGPTSKRAPPTATGQQGDSNGRRIEMTTATTRPPPPPPVTAAAAAESGPDEPLLPNPKANDRGGPEDGRQNGCHGQTTHEEGTPKDSSV